MKDIKDALLYLDSFDENNMFNLEQNKKLNFVSEVLGSEMNRIFIKHILYYCEDAYFDLIDLTVKLTDMVALKNSVCYKKIKNCALVW